MGVHQSIQKVPMKEIVKCNDRSDNLQSSKYFFSTDSNSTDTIKKLRSCCYAYSASIGYINAVIRFCKSRSPPSFNDCFSIACYTCSINGSPIESLRLLESHYLYGIEYLVVKSENFSMKDAMNFSAIACFTTSKSGWNDIYEGELINSKKPEESFGWHSCVIEGFDYEKDCLICKNSWGNEQAKSLFLFRPNAAHECYFILIGCNNEYFQRKTTKISIKNNKKIEEKTNQNKFQIAEEKNNQNKFQIAEGKTFLNSNKICIEDLLGRETIKVNMDEIYQHIKGKRILVTGGGGSIGSELCRQIAEHEPDQLIIFDIYENNAYDIQQELIGKYGKKLNLVVLIGSVRDSRRISNVFEKYRPQIVYHAAAHKHVPLMENSPCEAIKNNVIGTYKTAYSALKYGTERFILISTDKAVNPTSIMGASKRLCEMVIQTMDAVSRENKMDILPILNNHNEGQNDKINTTIIGEKLKIDCVENKKRKGTQFAAVRFGNVLGSNGSVIPLFIKQIENKGPVTVTDPEITRYFMTIPEAVSLVLQAEMYAWGGEIFVFDMGDPVKIDTLARNLIKLYGYKPDVDIKIEYIGLRPGEKLYEEKLMIEEGMKKTDNKLIHIGKPIEFDIENFLVQLEKLAKACNENNKDIVKIVEKLVPTFHSSGEKPIGSKRFNTKN